MKTMIRKLFLPEKQKNKLRKTYVWSVLSGGLYSTSTFLMFWVTTFFCGAYEAGIFTMAMSVGQQLVTIGYFNVRTFQVSDVRQAYSFADYFLFRILTCLAMAATGMVWMFAGGFQGEKLAATAILLVFKVAEAFADVMEGLYQQRDRYDGAARAVFWETLLFLGTFALTLALSRSLIPALCVMTGVYLISVIVIDGSLVGVYERLRLKMHWEKQRRLFFACLPLFLNSFLVLYINNASKYAVDSLAGSRELAYFNIIYMPAFVINMLGGFLLKPMLSSLSLRFQQRELAGFCGILRKQALYIGAVTALCVGGAWLLGIPVLSFIYQTDLTGYRQELCVLVLAGAFSALYLMFQYALIIMRHQYASLVGCTVTAAAAWICIPRLVGRWGVSGAAWGYLMLMILISLIYFGMMMYYYRKEKRSGR